MKLTPLVIIGAQLKAPFELIGNMVSGVILEGIQGGGALIVYSFLSKSYTPDHCSFSAWMAHSQTEKYS